MDTAADASAEYMPHLDQGLDNLFSSASIM